MANTAAIEVEGNDWTGALRNFFDRLLSLESIDALLVPQQLPMRNTVMPMLVADPGQLARAAPLSPAFPMNGAKLLSRLTRKPAGGRIAAVMRPCEIRAFIELVKLKQGRTEDLLIVGLDCLGAVTNRDWPRFAAEDLDAATGRFLSQALGASGESGEGPEIARACRACEAPLPDGADLAVELLGAADETLVLRAQTPAGEAALTALELAPAESSPRRREAVEARVAARRAERDRMFAETRAATGSLEKLTAYLANCVNCYNCRVACPVCYCRECVFVTDVFDHEPSQYLGWAARKGAVKMPTDTVFYHLTRLAHMSTACVGCGQCSNACPNDVPVMELFRSVADRTQAGFGYRAGASLADPPPLSQFREDEFTEVVGIE